MINYTQNYNLVRFHLKINSISSILIYTRNTCNCFNCSRSISRESLLILKIEACGFHFMALFLMKRKTASSNLSWPSWFSSYVRKFYFCPFWSFLILQQRELPKMRKMPLYKILRTVQWLTKFFLIVIFEIKTEVIFFVALSRC